MSTPDPTPGTPPPPEASGSTVPELLAAFALYLHPEWDPKDPVYVGAADEAARIFLERLTAQGFVSELRFPLAAPLTFAAAVHEIRDLLSKLGNIEHENHPGAPCPICGVVTSLQRRLKEWDEVEDIGEVEPLPPATDQYVEALVSVGVPRPEAERRVAYARGHGLCSEPTDPAKARWLRESAASDGGAA